MADEKKVELDAKTQDPQYLYHLTQKYMLDYVENRGTTKDQKWFYELVLASKKTVKRGESEFDVLDTTKVRKEFAKRFFPDLGKRDKKKESYFDIIAKRLEKLGK